MYVHNAFFYHKNDGEKYLAPKTKPQQLFKMSPIHLEDPVDSNLETLLYSSQNNINELELKNHDFSYFGFQQMMQPAMTQVKIPPSSINYYLVQYCCCQMTFYTSVLVPSSDVGRNYRHALPNPPECHILASYQMWLVDI